MPLHFNKTGSKYDRLEYIYDRLSRSPDGVTIKDLTDDLKVSTKTIQRDLHEALSGSGVYCDGRRWKLNRTTAADGLGNEERIILGVLDSLAKHAGPAFYNKAHQLLEQVSCQLEHPLFTNLDSETLSQEHLELFTIVENAIKSRNLIQSIYTTKTKEKKEYKFKPLRLAFFDGYWYLLAFDTNDKDSFKKFHLKSISNVSVLDDTFIYPKDISQKIEKAFSVWFTLEEPFEVRLWVSKEIAPYIERKPFHSQSIQGKDTDGSLELVVKVTHEMEILPIVLWYLPYIRILEPSWLNDKLIKKIEDYQLIH